MIFQVELREDIGKAIPCIVECLRDSNPGVRSAAVSVLSLLGSYRTCSSDSPLLVS